MINANRLCISTSLLTFAIAQKFPFLFQDILENSYDGLGAHCVLVNFLEKNIAAKACGEMFFLSPTFSATWISFVKSNCYFATGVADTDNATELLEMARFVHYLPRHHMVIRSAKKPTLKDAALLNRALLWLSPLKKDAVDIQRWCPVVGRPRVPHFKRVAIGSLAKDGSMGPIKDSLFDCPNPLDGQDVVLGTSPILPNVYLPSRFGGRPMAGLNVRYIQLMSRHFRFRSARVRLDRTGAKPKYDRRKGRYVRGSEKEVADGDIEFTGATHNPLVNHLYDITHSFIMGEMVYGSSVPQRVVSLDNITEPFPGNVWIYTVLTLLLFSFLSYTFHWAYQKLGHGLVRPESDKSNFFLFTFCKITEPEPLPWFDRVAGGKLCVTSWGIFCLFMIMFYQSNLRAHMITAKYERPIETLEDVLLRARRVWLPTVAVTLSTSYLSSLGMNQTIRYKIAQKAEVTGGIAGSSGYPMSFQKDVLENGAVFLTTKRGLPYNKNIYPLMALHKIRVTKENAETYFFCFILKKLSPATEYINALAIKVPETGLMRKYETEYLSSTSLVQQRSPKVDLKKLTLENFITSFIFYGSGMVVALGFFLAKDIRNRNQRKEGPSCESFLKNIISQMCHT